MRYRSVRRSITAATSVIRNAHGRAAFPVNALNDADVVNILIKRRTCILRRTLTNVLLRHCVTSNGYNDVMITNVLSNRILRVCILTAYTRHDDSACALFSDLIRGSNILRAFAGRQCITQCNNRTDVARIMNAVIRRCTRALLAVNLLRNIRRFVHVNGRDVMRTEYRNEQYSDNGLSSSVLLTDITYRIMCKINDRYRYMLNIMLRTRM